MKPQHLTLMHGGRCPCPRCKFEHRAILTLVFLAGAVLAMLGVWADAAWMRWVVGR